MYKTENKQEIYSLKAKLMCIQAKLNDTWRTITDASTDVNPESMQERKKRILHGGAKDMKFMFE